jgi:divalent metal cation (Fe/Co/Zn/Cd) transporter
MPGFRRWHPSEEPFSYTKLCFYYIPCCLVLLVIAALLVSAFGKLQWLDGLVPSSIPWGIAIGAAFVVAYYLFFMKLLWKLLPASVRARIPYDAKEANESKGDIRSLWDLRKLWSGSSSAS